jgi:hypothetical protein
LCTAASANLLVPDGPEGNREDIMSNLAFADELVDDEIYATETDPEDEDLDEDLDEDDEDEGGGIHPDNMPQP